MNLPPDLILLCTAGIVLLGNSQRSPKQDRTVVASAAFVALLLGLAAQLPYRGWYIFSIICLFIYGMVVLCAAVFLFVFGPGFLLDVDDIDWQPLRQFYAHMCAKLNDEKRTALAMGIWSAEIWGIWSMAHWIRSLPAYTNVPIVIATLLCPFMKWHYQSVRETGALELVMDFRPEPSHLLEIESCIGFVGIVIAIAYSSYQHIQRRKVVTPDLSLE